MGKVVATVEVSVHGQVKSSLNPDANVHTCLRGLLSVIDTLSYKHFQYFFHYVEFHQRHQ